MGQKSQKVKGKENGGKMQFPMAKVVLQMISVVFKDVDGLVFDLPTGAPDFTDKRDIVWGQNMVSDP